MYPYPLATIANMNNLGVSAAQSVQSLASVNQQGVGNPTVYYPQGGAGVIIGGVKSEPTTKRLRFMPVELNLDMTAAGSKKFYLGAIFDLMEISGSLVHSRVVVTTPDGDEFDFYGLTRTKGQEQFIPVLTPGNYTFRALVDLSVAPNVIMAYTMDSDE